MTEYLEVEGKRFEIGDVKDLPPKKGRSGTAKHYPELTAFAQLPEGKTLLIPCREYTMRDTQTFWASRFRALKPKPHFKTSSRFDHGSNGVRFWWESVSG